MEQKCENCAVEIYLRTITYFSNKYIKIRSVRCCYCDRIKRINNHWTNTFPFKKV